MRASLHAALADPILGSVTFLNEIMDRYPKAISFAPGAPHERFFTDLDLAGYVEHYVGHLRRRGLDEGQIRRRLYQYGPSRGQINDLVADALRADEGIDVPSEAIVITVGCQEALFLVLRTLCTAGTHTVAVVDPSYVGILGAARLLELDCVGIPDLDLGRQLRAACEQARAAGRPVRALYVAPDYANPTGRRLSLADRHRLLDEAGRQDLLIIEDNAYGFTARESLPTLEALDTSGRVIYVGTFAKICFPGARVGFVVADQPVGEGRLLADELAAVKSMVTVNTSAVSQAVVGGMLVAHGGSLAAIAEEKAVVYQRNLRLLLDALDRHLGRLPGVRWNNPEGGFFVVLRLPVPVTDALLETSAGEYGVIWTPMRHFYLGGGGEYELRLACSYLDEDEIEEGVARLSELLGNLSPTRCA